MHEYGHHLFRSLLGLNFSINSKIEDHLCIDHSSPLDLKMNSVQSKPKRKVNENHVISSINEGFSDVFAMISLNGKFSMTKFGCMERSREVNHSFFLSKIPKKLTVEVIDKFQNQVKPSAKSCLVDTNFADIHNIGAIFAHGAYQLLQNTRMTNPEKIRFLYDWVKDLKSVFLESKNMEIIEIYNNVVVHFYHSLKTKTELTTYHCDQFFSVFPVAEYTCH